MSCTGGTLDCGPSDPKAAAAVNDPRTYAEHERPLVRPRSIGGSKLVRDYLDQHPIASQFFGSSPFHLQSFREKLVDITHRFGSEERAAAASALIPTSPAAREKLARFVAEGGAVVTTGQQAGFLTGPLFTIYKALSTVVLARHLEARLGIIVLPVFWIASEDHDWEEVNHAYLLDPPGRLRRFTLPGENARSAAMSEFQLSGDLGRLCDDIVQFVGANDTTVDYVKSIVGPFRGGGRSMADAFRDAIAAVLRPYDVLLADAANPHLKTHSASILSRAVADAEEHERRLAGRTADLERAGYGAQVAILERGTNVFSHDSGSRERIFRAEAGSGYTFRNGRTTLSREALLADIDARPTQYSPNVLLRPVVESAVFPTLAYVGGPGELAYFAQVNALFDAFEIMPPVAVPRFSGVVVEASVERALDRLGIGESDLDIGREILVEHLARDAVPDDARTALERLRRDMVDGFDELIASVEEIEGTLGDSLSSIRNRILLGTSTAERKIIRSIKRRKTTDLARLDRVYDALRPLGQPQDRIHNLLPYAARYGEYFLTAVEQTLSRHWRLPAE